MTLSVRQIDDHQILTLLVEAETKICTLKSRVDMLGQNVIRLESKNAELIEEKGQIIAAKELQQLEVMKKTNELEEVKALCVEYKKASEGHIFRAELFVENSQTLAKTVDDLISSNQLLEQRVKELSEKIRIAHENTLIGRIQLFGRSIANFYNRQTTAGKTAIIVTGVGSGSVACGGICYGIVQGIKAGMAAGGTVGGPAGAAVGGVLGGAVGGLLGAAAVL